MDSLKPDEKQTQSMSDLNESFEQSKDVKEKIRSDSGDMGKKYTSQTTKGEVKSAPTISDEGACRMDMLKRPLTSRETSKDKNVSELFPWLEEALKINVKYVGSITELKTRNVLNAMDSLIENLSVDHDKYSKSPKISRALIGYLRRFLYAYRHSYKGFEKGKDYFHRIVKLLASYTDLELCTSVLGKELDSEIANRVQIAYITYLQYADDTSILDVFINMKRLFRLHGGILNILLRHNLVKLSITKPIEVSDDIFIKHLIVFKKWLAIGNFTEERQSIRRAFISQVKPQQTLWSNSAYAPYLPAEGRTTTPTENFVHFLDKKYSLEPLIQTLKSSQSNDQPTLLANKISEIVILSDDEDDSGHPRSFTVKIEPGANRTILNTSNASSTSNMVDLTDEVYDETDVPRHYISWLADLIARAKSKPITVDQRLRVASVSNEVIVIDDSEELNSDKNQIPNQHETQNENIGSGLCASLNDVGPDTTQIPSNQFAQNKPEQTNDESAIKQLNNSNEQSIDSISLAVRQTDGCSLPLKNIKTGSINSCSDMAAEQISNIELGNQKSSEQNATMDKISANIELTAFVAPTTTITTIDSEIKNDSVNHELLENNNIPTPTIFTEPAMTEENEMNEALADKNMTEQHTLTEQSSIPNDCSAKNVRSHTINRMNNVKQSTIKIVHPTRHSQRNDNESNPMDNEHELPNKTQCSIPLAQIKTNTLMLRNSDEHIKRPEQSQQNEKIEIDSAHSDRNGKLMLKSIRKMSPNPNSDRMSRSAHTANDINNTSDNNVPLVIRRKVPEQIDNENIPSTIMERKTYIKPVNIGIKSTNKSQQQTNGRQTGSQISPTTSDSRHTIQQSASHLINEHQSIIPSKNAAIATVQQPPQSFKVFYSDEKVPYLTPYDTIPVKQKKSKRTSKRAKSPSPQRTHHLTERFAKCNITQESLAKAASQLVEICKNTSPIRKTVSNAPPVVSERRNGRRFLAAATAATAATTPNQIPAAATETTIKRSPASRMPMPNFIVTKVTEKKRINVNNCSKILNQTPQTEFINKTNNVKTFREQPGIAKTKMLVESQRQKSLNLFNKCDSNSIIDNRANKVYPLNLNTHNKITNETKSTPKNGIKAMGFHVKNVRTSVHSDQTGADTNESSRSPTEYKLVMNGGNSLETSGKKFRLVKVVTVNNNQTEKSIPKKFVEKMETHSPNAKQSSYNFRKLIEKKRSSSVPRTRFINRPSYESPKKLVRRNSCYIGGIRTNSLVEQAARKNNEFVQLYDICSNIILKSVPEQQLVKKRGRPKKRIYKSTTKDLLRSTEFSVKTDLIKLNEEYSKERSSSFGIPSGTDDTKLMRRIQRLELLSIEPVLSVIRPNDKAQNFHMNAGLQKLSRLKTNNNYRSMNVISIAPQKSELLSAFPGDQNQEIGDLFESAFIDNDLGSANDLTIEYLTDIDEIKSPAYEPHISTDTNDPAIFLNNINQNMNDEPFHFVNGKVIEAAFYGPYAYPDSFVFDDVETAVTIELTNQMSKTAENDISLSPIRKSTRKRKVPVDFVSPFKKSRY